MTTDQLKTELERTPKRDEQFGVLPSHSVLNSPLVQRADKASRYTRIASPSGLVGLFPTLGKAKKK